MSKLVSRFKKEQMNKNTYKTNKRNKQKIILKKQPLTYSCLIVGFIASATELVAALGTVKVHASSFGQGKAHLAARAVWSGIGRQSDSIDGLCHGL